MAFLGIMMLIAGWKKAFAKRGGWKTFFMLIGAIILIYGLVGIGAQAEWYNLPTGVDNFFLSTTVMGGGAGGNGGQNPPINCPAGTTLQGGVCVAIGGGGANYQPTGTYTTVDTFSTDVITGTAYYKVGSKRATTTAQTNLNVGESVEYWLSNTTTYVKPVIQTATQGVNPFEAEGFKNASATITLYDTVNRQDVTGSGLYAPYNTSMGANDLANIEVTYQGTADYSAGPFGGVMVVEFNSTIAKLSATGDVLLKDNPYHVTWTPSATTHVYKGFAYSEDLDNGLGGVNRISLQFKNGATAVGAGSPYSIVFVPANYYVTTSGDIVLDTEKFADGDTTRTGLGEPRATGYWGA